MHVNSKATVHTVIYVHIPAVVGDTVLVVTIPVAVYKYTLLIY